MKYLTTITALVEVLHVPASATFDDLLDSKTPWVEPDFAAALVELRKIDGVRSAESVDTDNDQNPNKAGVEYELRRTVHAREFVGAEEWQGYREEFRANGEPMCSVTIVSDNLGSSDFASHLYDTIRPHLSNDYDLTVTDSFDVQESA